MEKKKHEIDTTISIYLDTRRAKEFDLFPVKLRVYSNTFRSAKLYYLKMDMTEKGFQSVWQTEKPRKEHQPKRIILNKVLSNANDVAGEIHPFTFHQFEKKFFRKTGDGENVFYQYQIMISKLKDKNRFGSADIYELSLKSLKKFIQYSKNKQPEYLAFAEITPDWLSNYEKYMLEVQKRSRTTVGMYLRALRAIFNNAISEKEVAPEFYPFGKRKYQIPGVRKVKKALGKEQLKKLFENEPKTEEQKKAKDFWFFSYTCNGMNIKDIALLRWENLNGDALTFYRAKTINTAKTDLKPVIVYLNSYSKSIIEKYGNPDKDKNKLIFPFIANGENEFENFKKIKNFIRFINQNLKKFALSIGLSDDISSYWARHSFVTQAIRSGASMEFVSEALNHSNLKTTQNYFAGFEEAQKKELMSSLMNF